MQETGSSCILKKRGNAQSQFGHLHVFRLKTAKNGFQVILAVLFYSLSFFFRKESNAITVLATVATQVTTAITNSKVIDKPPYSIISV